MKAPASEAVHDLRPGMLFQCNFRDALREPGCPLCRLLREADRYYLRVFLREGKSDGRMVLRLLASWGLCARHAAGLVWIDPREFGDGLGTGSFYDWLLDQAERLLGRFREELAAGHPDPERPWTGGRAGRQAARTLRQLSVQGGCPACEAAREHADFLLTEFLRALEPAADLPELIALYRSSEGLAFPTGALSASVRTPVRSGTCSPRSTRRRSPISSPR